MARDPAERYPSAKDLAADLGRFLAKAALQVALLFCFWVLTLFFRCFVKTTLQQKHILGKDGRAIPSTRKVAFVGPITILNSTIFCGNCVSSLFARVWFGSLVVSLASDLRRVFLAAALHRGIYLVVRDSIVVRFALSCLYLTLTLTHKCVFFDCTHIISAPFTYRPSTYKCFSTACRVSYNLYSVTVGTYTIRPESLVKAC